MRLIGWTLALTACACGTSKTAYAGPLDTRAVACTVNFGGTTNKGNLYLAYAPSNNTYTVSPQRTSQPMPSAAPAGTVLFSTYETRLNYLDGPAQGTAAPLYNCPSGTMEFFDGRGAYDSVSRSYSTGVQGIGYRVYYYLGNGEELAAPQQFQNPFAAGTLVFPMSSNEHGEYRTRIDFVATGSPIRAGTINAGNVLGQSSVSVGVNGLPQLYQVRLGSNITINAPTCQVLNQANLTVTMKDASVAGLNSGVDPVTKHSTELIVDCNSISQNAPTIQVSGSNLAPGYASTLANTKQGAQGGARGVGLRVWLLNPASGAWDMPTFNQPYTNRGKLVGTSGSTSLWSYTLAASYLKTEETIVPGDVSGTATLTFTYS